MTRAILLPHCSTREEILESSVRVGAVLHNGSKPAPVSALCQLQNAISKNSMFFVLAHNLLFGNFIFNLLIFLGPIQQLQDCYIYIGGSLV